jgi:hypothetical protein
MRYKEKEVVIPELEGLVGKRSKYPWSEEDLDILWKYYGSVEAKELAKIFTDRGTTRTVAAVHREAGLLNIGMKDSKERYTGKKRRK